MATVTITERAAKRVKEIVAAEAEARIGDG